MDSNHTLPRGIGAVACLAVLVAVFLLFSVPCAHASQTSGWKVKNDRLYYVKTDGSYKTSCTYQGITLTKSGAAKVNTASKLKRKCMYIVRTHTSSKMSRYKRLKAMWSYCTSHYHFSYASKYPDMTKAEWSQKTAYNMLTTRSGNCYGFACAFAYLAYEVGYDSSALTPRIICGKVHGSRDGGSMTRHAWVKIGSRYFDPEAKFAGWYQCFYSSAYEVVHTVSGKVRAWSTSASSVTLAFSNSSNGLHTYKGELYYVSDHKPLKSTWRTVGKYRYYFDRTGKALSGVVKISGKYYLFANKHRLSWGKKLHFVHYKNGYYRISKHGTAVSGWCPDGIHCYTITGRLMKRAGVWKGKLYAFGGYGRYNAAKTKALRALVAKLKREYNASAAESSIDELKELLGAPDSRFYVEGCYSMTKNIDGVRTVLGGKDGIWRYGALTVYTFKCDDGQEYLVSVE